MTKVAGFLAKVSAVLFTSIMAPLLVSMALRNHQEMPAKHLRHAPSIPQKRSGDQRSQEAGHPSRELVSNGALSAAAAKAVPRPSPQTRRAPFPTPVSQAPEPSYPGAVAAAPPRRVVAVTQVIAQGVGRTPDAALQDGLRKALRQALAAQVDAATWARSGHALFERVLGHGDGLILGFKRLGASKEWRLLGTLHHQDVAVEVDRQALVAGLKAAQMSVRCCYPGVWRPIDSLRRSPGAGGPLSGR
jgi:hypothetical protein